MATGKSHFEQLLSKQACIDGLKLRSNKNCGCTILCSIIKIVHLKYCLGCNI